MYGNNYIRQLQAQQITRFLNEMSDSKLRAAILVVSTTAAKEPSADSSGDILKETIDQDGGDKWKVVDTKIVPDNVLDIQRSIMQWADQEDPVNLIISTGGTGFAVSDNTPEVCSKAQVDV